MAKNLKFYFDNHGVPRARGPHSERVLMSFLELDVQGSDYICHDLMNDLTAIEDETADSREFIGNAHSVVIKPDGVIITLNIDNEPVESNSAPQESTAEELGEYRTGLKHFREILEDWEAFILDEQDPIDDSLHV